MAKRKKKRALSSPGLSRKVKTHRRRSHKRKGMLSELMSKESAMSGIKSTAFGGAGGFGWGLISPALGDMSPITKGAIAFGISWLTGSILKQPTIGAGVSGAFGYELAQKGLSEFQDHDYADTNLEEEPEYMDEDGEPMFLAGDGQLYYLDEFNDEDGSEMSEPMYLAEEDYFPDYANRYN